jgi:predicted DNA-binding transcriptional regulator AlpA
MNEPILLDAAQVAEMLTLNTKTFYHVLKTKAMETFPKPILFGERLSRWRKSDVEDWINAGATKQA